MAAKQYQLLYKSFSKRLCLLNFQLSVYFILTRMLLLRMPRKCIELEFHCCGVVEELESHCCGVVEEVMGVYVVVEEVMGVYVVVEEVMGVYVVRMTGKRF